MPSIIRATTTSGLQVAPDNSGSLQLQTNGTTTAVTIDTSQNVGIGTTSPSSYNGVLNAKAADRAVIGYFGGTTYATRIGANSSYATVEGVDAATGVSSFQPLQFGGSLLKFDTGGTERWRIDSSGILSSRSSYASGTIPLALGSSGGGYPVDRGIVVYNTAGAAIPFIAFTNTTTQAGYILTSGSTIAFVQGSDYRLKENVVDMDKSETLSKLMEVRPVNFDWKDGNTLHNYGFLAHELQETFPQAVHGEKDAVNEDGSIKTQSVNLTALVPYLVASIQEQQTIINDLKARIKTLEAK